MTTRRANLERLFRPRHIAFVGGASAGYAAAQCLSFGFPGTLWGVNPKRSELGGAPCFASVAELPEGPDAVFLAVPREHAVATVADLAARGAGAIVSYTAGFAETGADGAALEAELIAAAGETAFIGPNCLGVLNYARKALLWPFDHGGRAVERGIGFVSQSGMLCTNLTMNRRHADFSMLVSIGNQAVVTIEDVIEAMIDDEAVSAIGLYIEGLKNVPRFAEVTARALEAGKPVVAMKSGRSEIGARMTVSHTGSLAGSDTLYDALFARCGVLRVDSPTALLETLKMLSIAGAPAGRRTMAFTCSGGDAAMLADYGERFGLAYAQPSAESAERLRPLLPPIATVANPLDYTTPLWGKEAELTAVLDAALAGPCDVAIMAQDHPRPELGGTNEDYRADTRAFIAATGRRGIPAAVASGLSENIDEATRDLLVAGGVAPLQGLDEAVAAIDRAIRWGARRQAVAAQGGATALALVPLASTSGRDKVLDETAGKALLSAAGVAVPSGLVTDAAGAPRAAETLGFPVAVKLVSAALPHKSEAGAVALGLASPLEVARAVAEMTVSVKARAGIDAENFLVERLVTGAVAELLVGVRRVEGFGLALTIAGGGTMVELLRDATTLLLPASRAEIAEALGGLKVAQLLAGWRGKPAGDVEAAIDAIAAITQFALAQRDSLIELDVNPLIVTPKGATAADVLLRRAMP
ncbi:MAG: acetate--CoA ligase family protein [Proteobacteria bacterium]|nr:acetate--CoA ligase family protein [Pseudomonadota bacterium]